MDKVVITQARSAISSNKSQRATLRSLGLRRISSQVQHNATPQIMGQVQKVAHLVRFEMVVDKPAPKAKPTAPAKAKATKTAKPAPKKSAKPAAKPKTASKKRVATKTKSEK